MTGRAEYLLFDLAVLAFPLALSFGKGPLHFTHRFGKALTALAVGGAPFIAWDVLVAGRHWSFSEAHTLGPSLLGLPLEEWGFFVAVPFACLYTWESLLGGDRSQASPRLRFAPWAVLALAPVGAWVFTTGLEYTGLSLLGLGLAAGLDLLAGTRLLQRPRAWVALGVVGAFTVAFNNFLTGRPIVLYDAQYQLGVRVFTMPLEDLGFGLALFVSVLTVYEWLEAQDAANPSFGLVARLIKRRLRGYRVTVTAPDASQPERFAAPVRVAVIGGGLAGVTAAVTLAERGAQVTLLEKNDYLGGKVGGWTMQSGGQTLQVEHGFHAFFRQYYALRGFLARAGVMGAFKQLEDYTIWTKDGRTLSFGRGSTVPIFNLLALARAGLYRLWPVATGPAAPQMEQLLRYEREKTFADFDEVSFAQFARVAQLPEDLKLVFTTFSRAFFADGEKMSMAELIKSFHFYYLSNDRGLGYDFLASDPATALWAPLRRRFEAHGGQVRLSTPVEALGRAADGGLVVNGERFDWVVLAADVPGTRAILQGAPALLAEDPELARRMEGLKTGQRYAVLRVWLEAKVDRPGPEFIITERRQALDAVTFTHRVTDEAAAWAAAHGGSVLELHCYAVPDGLPDDAVRGALLEDLYGFVPEAKAAGIVHEHLQLKRDFPAFHVGMAKDRPGTASAVKGLLLAGDWVRLEWPAMLMEAACASGLHAANQVLAGHGVRQVQIDAVPPKGLLAGVPSWPPGKRVARDGGAAEAA